MKGRLIDLSRGMNGRQRITVELQGDFRDEYDKLKDDMVSVEIKKFRNKRSKDANAYFHVLVAAIAEAQGLGNEEVKRQMVEEYGTLSCDEHGEVITFQVSAHIDPHRFYPYIKQFDELEVGGKLYRCYMAFRHTHELDTKEMSRLIDGTIYVAKDLGIEIATPEELARLKSLWTSR